MLTPEYLQGAPAELEALFLQLEEEVIKDICRRIAKEGRLTDSAADQAERLRDLGAGTDYIKRKISEYSELSSAEVDRLFFDAAQTSDEFYRNVYDRANKEYTPFEYNDYLQQAVTAAVNQTKGELRNLTQSMGFSYRGSNGQVRFHTAAEAYRDCLDYAFLQTSTGMTDYNTAVRNATRRLTESGLQFVDYASGVRNHADVAVRRAVLTGLSQYTGKIAERNAQELDTDIVEVTAHSGARPDHAEWQGRWYSLSGKSKQYPSLVQVTGYGTVTGLKGANCSHEFYPVIPGISEPSYTEEELKNIDPPPFEYNGKTYTCYEATQRQRYMERAMRKTKRELLAADSTGDKDRFTEKSVLLRRQREEYGKFSKAAGLLTQNERTQVNGFGRSQASKASWAAKKGQGSSGSSAPASGSSSGSSSGTPFQTSIPQNNVMGKTNQIVVDRPTATSGEKELFRGLTSGGGSGIMNTKPLFRKKSNSDQNTPKPISDRRFSELIIEAKKSGAEIIRNDPWFNERLKENNASAATYGDILVFGENATISDVLEETYHFKQNLKKLNDDKPHELRIILNEIDAKEYLINNAYKFKIPRIETELTQKQLESYKELLEEMLKE